jgi:inner membrane protein
MNGKAHATIGLFAGPATGLVLAIEADRSPTLGEICGWAAGGLSGAKLPDILEPTIHPGHRKFCHSGTVLVADLAFLQCGTLKSWIQWLHDEAAKQRTKALLDPGYAILHSIAALILEFLAGVLPAVPAGYASHLIADCTTPYGIPIC